MAGGKDAWIAECERVCDAYFNDEITRPKALERMEQLLACPILANAEICMVDEEKALG
jgi:RecA-family ATPase